jgi:hypothetical protein
MGHPIEMKAAPILVDLLVMRRVVRDGVCTYGPPNSKPWGSSTATAWGVFLGAIVERCSELRGARYQEEACVVVYKRGRRDGLIVQHWLLIF